MSEPLTAESLPFFLFGLPAGALADIIDRRRLLIVSQLAMAITVGTLAILQALTKRNSLPGKPVQKGGFVRAC